MARHKLSVCSGNAVADLNVPSRGGAITARTFDLPDSVDDLGLSACFLLPLWRVVRADSAADKVS